MKSTRSAGGISSPGLLPPLAALGSVAAVLLAGLVFWGLDADGVKSPKAELATIRQHSPTAPSPRIKTPPAFQGAKPEPEKNELELAPHPPRNGAEKPLGQTSAAAEAPGKDGQPRSERLEGRESAQRVEGGERSGVQPEVAAESSTVSARHQGERPSTEQRAAVQNGISPAAETSRGGEPSGTPRKETVAALPKGELLALNVPPQARPEPPAATLPPREASLPPLARVAIVIDDLGRDLDAARTLADIPISITFSVLPFQNHSKEVMALARARGREVILHMPMEPEGYPQVNPGRGALLVSMRSRDIQKNLRTALDETPHVRGINNHMGSRFTEQTEQMGVVMKELQRRRLFFLDSATTVRSVALDAAQSHGVPYLRRDVFLDHVLAESFVRAQIGQLIRRARVQGTAVAIGHPHEVTLKVLKEENSAFEREKIAVVPASRLLSAKMSRNENR